MGIKIHFMRTIQTIAFLMFLLIGSFSFAQTGVTVTYYNGTAQGFNVDTTGKLYFANDDLYVKIDGTTNPTTIPVNIIQKITFSSTLSTVTFGENPNNMVLYPNPGSDIIKINSNVLEDLNVKVFSLSGQLMQQGTYTVNQDIDVSRLSTGLYLVQVNGLTFKFSKK